MRRPALLALATGLLVAGGSSGAIAWADAPEKTAWFTVLSAGPLTVPAPTAAEGDLRVSGQGTQPTSYATLSLRTTGDSGVLTLAVRSTSAGTPELALCPTKSPTWEAGGNQPFSAGPEYDCSSVSTLGMLGGDGMSVTFELDSSLLPAPGVVSLAVVPLPEGTVPFIADLGDVAFAPAAAAEPAEEAPAAEPAPAPEPTGGTGTAEAPPLAPDSGADLPPAPVVEDAPAPELAGVEAEPLAPEAPADAEEVAPDVALETPADQTVLPVTQVARSEDTSDGPRLVALLTLIGISAAAGYAAGQQRTVPRIIGGRARSLPAGAAGPGSAVAVAEPVDVPLERGIGRFSRLRDAAPRRLR